MLWYLCKRRFLTANWNWNDYEGNQAYWKGRRTDYGTQREWKSRDKLWTLNCAKWLGPKRKAYQFGYHSPNLANRFGNKSIFLQKWNKISETGVQIGGQ